MRLFISINLPPEIYPYCRELQTRFPGMKNTEEFHLTLQFLGDDIPEERLPEIKNRLDGISFTAFPVTLHEALPFPNPKAPSGVWIVCRGGVALHQLAERVRAAMGNLGYLPDERFLPHVTLGRYKKGPPAVPKLIPGESPSFPVDAFHLMQSYRDPQGPYKTLATFRSGVPR